MTNTDDPNVILSMSRNLGYKTNDAKPDFDVVFDAVIVVRDGNTDGEQLYGVDGWRNKLYSIASERLWLWYTLAVDFFLGNLEPSVDVSIPEENKIPARSGAPNVTVFGGIVDKQGRYLSLTVNDQTDPMAVYAEMGLAAWLYDEATALSCNVDLNAFGKKPNRSTTVNTKSNKGAAKPRVKKSNPKTPEIVEEKPFPLQKPNGSPMMPKVDPVLCETFSDTRSVQLGKLFRVPIYGIEITSYKGKQKAILRSARKADEPYQPPTDISDTEEGFWFYKNDAFDDKLFAILAEKGLDNIGTVALQNPLNLTAKAELSKDKNTVYYKFVSLE